jgi:hypothetical protein
MSTRAVTSRGVTALANGNPGRKLLKGAEMYALEQLQWRVTRPRDPSHFSALRPAGHVRLRQEPHKWL